VGENMSLNELKKPLEGEYASYAKVYIDLISESGSIIDHLQENLNQTTTLLRSFPAERLETPCAAGEWTIKEIVQHIIDGERVLAYRALRFARDDKTDLPGYDHDAFVPQSQANRRSLEDLLGEFQAVRRATVAFFRSLNEEMCLRRGTANGFPLTVRAAAYFIAGHEVHHFNSIKENYG
jgi:uncharacterized damage-inducible protein DinB